MNSLILDALDRHACAQPAACAVQGMTLSLSYAELKSAVDILAASLAGSLTGSQGARCVGLLLDNGPAWVVADLATLRAGITCVPLPGFFSTSQLEHVVTDAGVDWLLTDQPERVQALCGLAPDKQLQIADATLTLFRLPTKPAAGLSAIAKVTYTSGTTGTPKGVRLRSATIDRVVESLCAVTETTAQDCSLALLPLATLLENIASVYVMLQAGARCVVAPLTSLGMIGAARLQPTELLRALQNYRPSGIVLIPQLLQALVEITAGGGVLPDSLRFIAVGGAPVSMRLLERAQALGLPVYEGYGLSEAASVVTLNTPQARQIGSVGRPLPHVRLRIADDGEIHVAGAVCAGYLGEQNSSADNSADGYWPTGDIGHLDAHGFLHLTGRKKHIFITAFGRNVAPEWVERELLLDPAIAQIVVFGEARPFNVAIIVARSGATAEIIQAAIDAANRRLPDYARIARYILAEHAFTVENGLLTGTARPRRAQIAARYATSFQSLYNEVA